MRLKFQPFSTNVEFGFEDYFIDLFSIKLTLFLVSLFEPPGVIYPCIPTRIGIPGFSIFLLYLIKTSTRSGKKESHKNITFRDFALICCLQNPSTCMAVEGRMIINPFRTILPAFSSSLPWMSSPLCCGTFSC